MSFIWIGTDWEQWEIMKEQERLDWVEESHRVGPVLVRLVMVSAGMPIRVKLVS